MRRLGTIGLFVLVVGIALVVAQDNPSVETGTLDDETPFLEFPLEIETAGSTITLDMRASSGDLDTLIYLVDEMGSIVAENDDRAAGDFSSRLVFPRAEAGNYRVIATRYGIEDGTSSGEFRLEFDVAEPEAVETPALDLSDETLAAVGFPMDVEPAPMAQWTVLAYYGGDTNLEAGILNDFKEFERAGGSNDAVRIIMLADRHPNFTDASGDWSSTRIFEIASDTDADESDELSLVSEPIADLGERNTGDATLLAQFLVWALRTYPAENYALAFAGHGAGWEGIVTDESAGNTILTLPTLQQALDAVLETTETDKFALLINDACNMSSVEYYSVMDAYFQTSLASPEIVVNPALDMASFISLLNANVDEPDLADIGQQLVNQYIEVDAQARGTTDVVFLTSAVTDLSAFDPVIEAVEAFAALINEDPVVRSLDLGAARANTYVYTQFLGGSTQIDLGNLMRQVILNSTDADLIDAAEAVISALDASRIYGNAGARVASRTSYYNIYFPATSAEFDVNYFTLGNLPEWATMLRNFYNSVTPNPWTGGDIPFHAPDAPKIRITRAQSEPVSILNPSLLSVEIIGRNIATGSTTVDQLREDGSIVRYSTEPLLRNVELDGQLERINAWEDGLELPNITWDVVLPVLSDGVNQANELLRFTEEVAFLDGRYREIDSTTWFDVSVAFDFDGRVQRVLNRTEENNALAVIDIPTGAEFQVYRSTVTPDGRVITSPGNLYIWPEDGMTWEFAPAPSGAYEVGLLLTAFGGTTGFVSTTVDVNNDGVPDNLRGDSDAFIGFTVPRPADWEPLVFIDEEVAYRSRNPEGADNVAVYFGLELSEIGLASIANTIIDFYGLESDGNFTPGMVDDTPVVAFDYSYVLDDETIVGRMFVYYNEPLGIGTGIAVEGAQDDNVIDDLYPDVRNGTSIFDPLAFEANRDVVWDFDSFSEEVTYPIRVDWVAELTDDGWFQYTAPDDESGRTFIATQVTTTGLADGLRESTLDGVDISGNPVYNGDNHVWQATTYAIERDDIEVIGRYYTTEANDQVYVIWMEAPQESAASRYPDVFEVVVDGYVIEPIASE